MKRILVLKCIFFETYICGYLHTKFQVSSIILTSFRRGSFTPPPPPNETPKKPTQIRVNDGGEFDRVYPDIYPPELELKLENCPDLHLFRS